jgi:hypothetical protein
MFGARCLDTYCETAIGSSFGFYKKLLPWALFFFSFLVIKLHAYPSSLFWTTCTTDVVPAGIAVIEVAHYSTIFHKPHHGQILPPDVGLTLGVLKWRDWEAEVGVDYFAGLDYPWFFNAKIGIQEKKLFLQAPSFSVGIFDVGTKMGITNLNIVDAVIGKTLPEWLSGGRLFFGGFVGNRPMGKDQGGYMIGYLKVLCPAKDCYETDYWKWWLVADYASGKNFIGGGGVGVTYNFSSRASVLTGPTWFNDVHFNGKWKWTVQVFILFSAFQAR